MYVGSLFMHIKKFQTNKISLCCFVTTDYSSSYIKGGFNIVFLYALNYIGVTPFGILQI